LLNKNFEGTYVSFQRPFNNICSLFKHNNINLNKVLVVDAASALCGEMQEYNNRCVSLSDNLEIEEIVKVIYLSLLRLESENKFVFVDSLSTLALHENLSDSLKFPKSLINKIRQNHLENVVFIFNVADDIFSKRYAENILSYADQCIHLGLYT
jgi:archaellum biogenesis ATPase FlaH